MNDAISCIYWVGADSELTQNWRGDKLSLSYSKFYYVEEGEIVMQIYGQTITAGPGDLVLIPAWIEHSCWLPEGGYARKAWCHFTLRGASGKFFEQFEIPPMIHVEKPNLVKRLFRQMFASQEKTSPQKELMAATAVCSLVQYYFDNSKASYREIASDRIKLVIEYIEQHYAENPTLEQLAQVAGYSTTHLGKCFRDETGIPPIRYLNNVRIEQAKHMLQYADEPIGQIMEQCGFSDAAYFSRTIKKTLGYSPQTYRDMYRSSSLFRTKGRKKV